MKYSFAPLLLAAVVLIPSLSYAESWQEALKGRCVSVMGSGGGASDDAKLDGIRDRFSGQLMHAFSDEIEKAGVRVVHRKLLSVRETSEQRAFNEPLGYAAKYGCNRYINVTLFLRSANAAVTSMQVTELKVRAVEEGSQKVSIKIGAREYEDVTEHTMSPENDLQVDKEGERMAKKFLASQRAESGKP